MVAVVGVIVGSRGTEYNKLMTMNIFLLISPLTIIVSIDSSYSHSIHSKHCNIVGYSWFTRHCVATNRRAQLCLYHCAVITGFIGHNVVKDWELFISGGG